MACSKQEIENKRLAALAKIRTKHGLTPQKELVQTPDADKSNHAFGPVHQSNYKAKYQPYSKNSNSQQSSFKPDFKNGVIAPKKIVTGTIYMITEQRFEVKPSEFHEQLVAIFKTIPSKTYDCEKRLWNFSLQHYEELQNKILPLRPNIVIGNLPPYVLKTMREPNRNLHPDLSQIDPVLLKQLLPFQIDGVCFGIEKNGRCMIADDMGLGKTFQALAIANYYMEDWPLLIVTTSSMRETWESKIHELLPSIPMAAIICVVSGKEKQFLTEKQAKIIIISYKMTTLCTDLLIEKKFGAIILDESHLLKSYKAQSTDCIMKITKRARRVILLSGTPALSRPSELFTQLQIIEPKFFQGFVEFGKRYCDGKLTNFGWDMNGQSNLLELQILLQKKFLIRRTKDEVLTSLQDKKRESVILDSSLLAMSSKTKEGLMKLALSYTKTKSSGKHAALLSFFNESAKVKIPAICKYIEGIAKDGEKFLVFAHHRNVLDAICQTLDECRVHYINIDGSTKSEYRSILVEKFQHSDTCKCAVLSITAANAGITLTAAQLVIFAELHWNPGILTQAESRAHRIGQMGDVNVKYLLAKGTSDDYMWPMLEGKLQVLNQVGLTKDTFGNATLSKQLPESSITRYLSPHESALVSYIPGTNIVKGHENRNDTEEQDSNSLNIDLNDTENLALTETFLDDIEGDDLLAGIDFI